MKAKSDIAIDVPAHVPDRLVRSFDFRTGLGDRPQEAIVGNFAELPVFFSTHRPNMVPGGTWVVTSAEGVRKVLGNPATFSSAAQGEFMKAIADDIGAPPLDSDPPAHARFRSLINPLFSPQRMFALAPKIQSWCDELLDRFIDKGGCNFVAEFAEEFPTGIFIDLMGFPRDRLAEFVEWTQRFIHGETPEERTSSIRKIVDYFADVYDHADQQAEGSVTRYLLDAEPEGRKLTRGEFIGLAFILFTAGLDTVVSTLGFVFRALAEDQELQARLRASPEDLPRHLEEMMRLFSPVTPQRLVLHDTELEGVAMKAGDHVALSLACASRDAESFPDPDVLDATRNPNPHFGFGYGIHRCAGAQLARRDLVIALEQWFKRVPPFRLAPSSRISAVGGPVLALAGIDLEW